MKACSYKTSFGLIIPIYNQIKPSFRQSIGLAGFSGSRGPFRSCPERPWRVRRKAFGGWPPLLVFSFLLEVVAVADASVDRAGPVTDVRVSVHENGCLRSHRRAQPVSKLQCRQIHFLSTHALREAGLPSKDTFVPPPASQVLPAFTRISASASRSKMLLPTRPIHQ